MSKIPTIGEYIANEWKESDGLPGPAYVKKYGLRPLGHAEVKSNDLKKVYPIYGDCCDRETQYAPWWAFREAMQEIARLKAMVPA